MKLSIRNTLKQSNPNKLKISQIYNNSYLFINFVYIISIKVILFYIFQLPFNINLN